jgi:hypothetical protein
MQRLLVPVLPLVYLLAGAGMAQLAVFWGDRGGDRLLALWVLGQASYLVAGSLQAFLLRPPLPQEDSPVPGFLQRHAAAGDTIAVTDAGRIGYDLPLQTRVLDMVGLADRHIAHLPPRFPGGLTGRGDAFGKWDVDYVLAQRPRFVQVSRAAQQQGRWLTPFTGTMLLLNDARFQAEYEPVAAAGIDGVFVRRTAAVSAAPSTRLR